MAAQKTITDMKTTIDTATETTAAGAAQAQKFLEDGAAQARVVVEQGVAQATKAAEGLFKAAEQAAAFSRGNLEALTKATQLWTVGTQDLARQYFAAAQSFTDQAMEGAKALATVKSLKEATELQTSFAKAAMEKAVSDTAKFNEAGMKLAEQVFAPITAQVQTAMQKAARPLAA